MQSSKLHPISGIVHIDEFYIGGEEDGKQCRSKGDKYLFIVAMEICAGSVGRVIGKAILYTYGMYSKLVRYVMDGKYRIDNNLAENGVRPFAVGRKNYLFFRNHEAAGRTAIIFH